MNVVRHIKQNRIPKIQSKDIPVGTYFYWDEKEGLFLRTFDGIVCIDNPISTWVSVTVVGFRPVEVTVTVEKYL